MSLHLDDAPPTPLARARRLEILDRGHRRYPSPPRQSRGASCCKLEWWLGAQISRDERSAVRVVQAPASAAMPGRLAASGRAPHRRACRRRRGDRPAWLSRGGPCVPAGQLPKAVIETLSGPGRRSVSPPASRMPKRPAPRRGRTRTFRASAARASPGRRAHEIGDRRGAFGDEVRDVDRERLPGDVARDPRREKNARRRRPRPSSRRAPRPGGGASLRQSSLRPPAPGKPAASGAR